MRSFRAVLAAILFVGALAACSSEPPLDPLAIEATLSTEPSPAQAGSPAVLKAVFTGGSLPKTAEVNFDVRVGGKPELFDAVNEGDNLFTGTFTFPEKGVYDVYLHLYIEELHITKKGQVEVE